MRRPIALSAAAALVAGLITTVGAGPAQAAEPLVLPTPQSISYTGADIPLGGAVAVVADADVDAPSKRELTEVLAEAGATVTWATTAPDSGTVIHLSVTDAETQALAEDLGVEDASDLNDEGYVLATGTVSGQPTVLLEGKTDLGLFYAVDTFDQLVVDGVLAGAKVRDWPLMPIRGAIEGFYGIPWSHQARLDQLDFYGEHKMNTYIYTPKDDPYLRAEWRTLYPDTELDLISELVQRAKDNHVEFVFALSPGNDICYSRQSDYDATIAKFEQLRQIGVTTFYIALDDIDPYLKCAEDLAQFTLPGFRKLAEGQAYYLNKVIDGFIEPNGLQPLQTVPTNYAGSQPDAYKEQFGVSTDDSLIIQWTGEGVFSAEITMESVARARTTYVTDNLYIWDNFPVNDGQPDRLFLNPLDDRAPNLHEHILGFTSNPMVQAYASMIALAGYADYTWNGPAYQPEVTMERILDELAGDDAVIREALEVFVDLNQDWSAYRNWSEIAPDLGADIAAFWTAHGAGDEAGKAPLKARLAIITGLPTTLAGMAETGFYDDSKPWIDAAAEWSRSMQAAIVALEELDDDKAAAAAAILESVELFNSARDTQRVPMLEGQSWRVPKVGDGRFGTFLVEAYNRYEESLGGSAIASNALPATATTNLGQWSTNAPARMVDGDFSTLWWSNAAPSPGDWVQVDLGSAQPIGGISIHQADSDTARGDMIYHGALEYSADGTTWTTVGQFDDTVVVSASFNEAVQARYVRLRATAVQPANQWVKIREFQVYSPTGELLTTVPGANAGMAFDLDVTTAVTGAAEAGQVVQRGLSEPQTDATIRVLGGSGLVEAEIDGEWVELGRATSPWFERAVKGEVTGVRIVLDAGEANVVELVVAAWEDLNEDPTVTAVPATSVEEGVAVRIAVTATDPEGSALSYSATGLPAGVTIDPATGVISGVATVPGSYPVVVTVTDPDGGSVTTEFVLTVTKKATTPPTDPPTDPPTTPPGPTQYERTAPYTLAGNHTVDGRQWRTACEDYSQTERCRAEIWASVVKRTGNTYSIERGWAFNNLTYLPFMEREQWTTNPLGGYGRYGFEGEFVGTDGQKWRTECDSTASGRNGCRAYRMTTVYYANPLETGGYTFGQTNEWVFNNIVLFGNYAR